jgi:hypothetical protein
MSKSMPQGSSVKVDGFYSRFTNELRDSGFSSGYGARSSLFRFDPSFSSPRRGEKNGGRGNEHLND